MSSTYAAKRGQAVAVVSVTRDYVIGKPMAERERVEFGIVTSVTREGVVKRFRDTWGSERAVMPRERTLIVADVDAQELYEAARAHTWDGHPNQPKPFDSIADAKAFAAPFRKVASA